MSAVVKRVDLHKLCECDMQIGGHTANSGDPDQTAPQEEQSDLGLHYLLRPIHLNI